MKKALYAIVFAFMLSPFCSQAQAPGSQYKVTMTNVYGSSGTTDFLLFKPADSNSVAKHPLIIFLHGAGEQDSTDIYVLGRVGGSLPYHCARGASMRFTVNGVTSTFYVMSPKKYHGSSGSWEPEHVKNMIAYAKANLNVDTNRIYLTGLSMGGGGTWRFITDTLAWDYKLAAAAPVAGTQEMNDANYCSTIGTSHLPVWAFHCIDDGVVSVNATQKGMLDEGFNCPSNNPRLRTTYYKTGGHNGAWENAYDTGHITKPVDSSSAYSGGGPSNASFTANPNLYEWFLSKSRGPIDTTTHVDTPLHASYNWPDTSGDIVINPTTLTAKSINLQAGDTLVFGQHSGSIWQSLSVDHINGTATDTIIFKFLPGSHFATTIPWVSGTWDSVSYVKVTGAAVDGYLGIFAQIDNDSHDLSFNDGSYRNINNTYAFVLGDKWARRYFNGTKASTIYNIGWYNNLFDGAVNATFIQGNADSTWNIILDPTLRGNTFKNLTNSGAIPVAAISMKAFNVHIDGNRFDSILVDGASTQSVHTAYIVLHGDGDINNNIFAHSYANDMRLVPLQFLGYPGYSGANAKYRVFNNISHHKASYSMAEISPNNGLGDIANGLGNFAPCKSEVFYNTVFSTHRASYNGDYYGMVVDLYSDSAAIRHNVIVAPEIDHSYDPTGRGGYIVSYPAGPKLSDTSNNRTYATAAAAGLDTVNWRLQTGSPLIDASDSAAPHIAYDYYHTSRPQGSASDIGAIEKITGGASLAPAILTQNANTITDNTATGLSIFPNPATDIIQITAATPLRLATIYSAAGRQVFTRSCSGQTQLQVDISSLSKGIYIVRIVDTGGGTKTVKLIKK